MQVFQKIIKLNFASNFWQGQNPYDETIIEIRWHDINPILELDGYNYVVELERLKKQDEINNSQKISNQLIALFTGILILLTAYPIIKDGCITKKGCKKIEPQCQKTPLTKDSSLKNHTDSGIYKTLQDS